MAGLAEQLAKFKIDGDKEEDCGTVTVDVFADGAVAGDGGKVVRIVHISDTHGKHWDLWRSGAIPHGDVLVHSGDFMTAREKTIGEVEDVLVDMNRFFDEVTHREVIFVAGNHEYCMFDYRSHCSHITHSKSGKSATMGERKKERKVAEAAHSEGTRERKRDKVKKILSLSSDKEVGERKRDKVKKILGGKERREEKKRGKEAAAGEKDVSTSDCDLAPAPLLPSGKDQVTEMERRAQRAKRVDIYRSKEDVQNMLTNCHYLEGDMVEIDGIRFFGVPWNSSGMAFGLKGEERKKKWESVPGDGAIHVLVTHGPSFGILDKAWTNKEERYAAAQRDSETGKCLVCREKWHAHYGHWGCRILSEELERIRPRAVLFGHVHDNNGAETHLGILHVNSSMDLRPRAHVVNYHLPA